MTETILVTGEVASFAPHADGEDWCHICGERSETPKADIWYRSNAEHAHYEHDDKSTTEELNPSKYIRICVECCRRASETARGL